MHLEVNGARPTADLQVALAEDGFTAVDPTVDGFVAYRAAGADPDILPVA